MKSMSIVSQIITAEEGSRLFNVTAQVTRLLASAYAHGQQWSYGIERLKGPDGEILGKCFEDGCEIRIVIRPAASAEQDKSP